jgi:hypothetical protein
MMMSQLTFPTIPLADLQPTRDILQNYAKVLGKIRRALTPPQKHWWHISLRVVPNGLTTTAIPISSADEATCEMILNLQPFPEITMATSHGQTWAMPLTGQSVSEFCDTVLVILTKWGVEVDIDRSPFTDATPATLDPTAAQRYCQALVNIDQVFKQFKAELPGETGPVQLWPHHFDLAMLWFSGRKVPGVDPANEEYADEQMNFGFSTGDEGISNPYFYAIAYPWPEAIVTAPLPSGAIWHTQGWKGALLMYDSLVESDKPAEKLLAYLRAVYQAGSTLMR